MHFFAGEAVCSRVCLGVLVNAALRRELSGETAALPSLQTEASPYRHRIPLGLLMLSRQRISRQQLTRALERQKSAGQGRIGEWLIRTEGVQEETVAQALAVQWGVPMLTLGTNLATQMSVQLGNQSEMATAHLLPRLFVEAFGTVPVRVAAGRILYLAVDSQVDGCLNAAIAAMTGYTVEPGVMTGSDYHSLRLAVLGHTPAPVKLFSVASLEGLAQSIVELIMDSGAASSRLVRAREYIWVRTESVSTMTSGAATGITALIAYKDAIFTLPRHASSSVHVLPETTAFDDTSSPLSLRDHTR